MVAAGLNVKEFYAKFFESNMGGMDLSELIKGGAP